MKTEEFTVLLQSMLSKIQMLNEADGKCIYDRIACKCADDNVRMALVWWLHNRFGCVSVFSEILYTITDSGRGQRIINQTAQKSGVII